MSNIRQQFETVIKDIDYSKLPLPDSSSETANKNNKKTIHELIFECYNLAIPDIKDDKKPKAWKNDGESKCNKENEVEIPLLLKDDELPIANNNPKLLFREDRFWQSSDKQTMDDQLSEFSDKNIPIAQWNYLSKEDKEIINCKNTIETLNSLNNFLTIKYQRILEFAQNIFTIIPENDKFEFQVQLREIEKEQYNVQDYIKFKQKNSLMTETILLHARICIMKMAEEINSMRMKYKKTEFYNRSKDFIILNPTFDLSDNEHLYGFLVKEKYVQYNIGNKLGNNEYYFPEISKNIYPCEDLINIKSDINEENFIETVNTFLEKFVKPTDGNISEVKCNELLNKFHKVLQFSEIKSKIDFIEKYKDSYVHLSALYNLQNLQLKHMNETFTNAKDISIEIFDTEFSKEKHSEYITKYKNLSDTYFDDFNRETIKYPKGYIATIMINSFFEGITYAKIFAEKCKQKSDKEFIDTFFKALAKEKKIPLVLTEFPHEQITYRLNLNLLFTNNKQTISDSQFYIGFNVISENKDNILNVIHYNLVENINKQILENLREIESIGEFLLKIEKEKFKTLCPRLSEQFIIIHDFIQEPEQFINQENLNIFYYTNFIFIDALIDCYNDPSYKSAFIWESHQMSQVNFNERIDKSLLFYKNMTPSKLYISSSTNTNSTEYHDLYYTILEFSLLSFKKLFINFDSSYFYVILNSFFSCFIPFFLNNIKLDANTRNFMEIFEFVKDKQFVTIRTILKPLKIKLTVEEELCLKGIRITECDEIDNYEELSDLFNYISDINFNFKTQNPNGMTNVLFALFFKENNHFIKLLKSVEENALHLGIKEKLISYYDDIHNNNEETINAVELTTFLSEKCQNIELESINSYLILKVLVLFFQWNFNIKDDYIYFNKNEKGDIEQKHIETDKETKFPYIEKKLDETTQYEYDKERNILSIRFNLDGKKIGETNYKYCQRVFLIENPKMLFVNITREKYIKMEFPNEKNQDIHHKQCSDEIKWDIEFAIANTGLELYAIVMPTGCYFKIDNNWYIMNNEDIIQIDITKEIYKIHYQNFSESLIYFRKDYSSDEYEKLLDKCYNLCDTTFDENILLKGCASKFLEESEINCKSKENHNLIMSILDTNKNLACNNEAINKQDICKLQFIKNNVLKDLMEKVNDKKLAHANSEKDKKIIELTQKIATLDNQLEVAKILPVILKPVYDKINKEDEIKILANAERANEQMYNQMRAKEISEKRVLQKRISELLEAISKLKLNYSIELDKLQTLINTLTPNSKEISEQILSDILTKVDETIQTPKTIKKKRTNNYMENNDLRNERVKKQRDETYSQNVKRQRDEPDSENVNRKRDKPDSENFEPGFDQDLFLPEIFNPDLLSSFFNGDLNEKLTGARSALKKIISDNTSPWMNQVLQDTINEIDTFLGHKGGNINSNTLHPILLKQSDHKSYVEQINKRFSLKKNKLFNKLSKKKI